MRPSMNVCDKDHEEIVYTDQKCPLCEALDEIERLKDERDDLQADIDRIVKDAEKEAI